LYRRLRNVPLFEPLRRETFRAFRLETFGTRNQPSAPPARRASAYSSSKELQASSPRLRAEHRSSATIDLFDSELQTFEPKTACTKARFLRRRHPKETTSPAPVLDTAGPRPSDHRLGSPTPPVKETVGTSAFGLRHLDLRSRRPFGSSTPPARRPSVSRIVDASKPGSLRISGQSPQHLEPQKPGI